MRESKSDNLPGAALGDAKRAARERVLAARDSLAADDRDSAAAAITHRITALPSFQAARTVLLTLPFRSEWNTRPLVHAALAADKRVALPRVDAATRMLVLHALVDPVRDVVPGYAGIPEPGLSCPRVDPETIQWVLVPGVAFDAGGRRLGYGGGFYDRLLPLLPPNAVRVAGAFDLQLIDRVPAAAHDVAVDAIVTETRTLFVRAA